MQLLRTASTVAVDANNVMLLNNIQTEIKKILLKNQNGFRGQPYKT